MRDMPWRFLKAASERSLARSAELTIEHVEHVPERGGAILAVRHVHHQHDGEVLLAAIPRPVHIVAALDWTTSRASRAVLGTACKQARWPAVVRDEAFSTFGAEEARRINARAVREVLALLDEGRIVAMFPQAYPVIDNNPRPASLPDGELPFRSGFAQIARLASRSGNAVPIVPVGLAYERSQSGRWQITARFGPPIDDSSLEPAELLDLTERMVRNLSLRSSVPPNQP